MSPIIYSHSAHATGRMFAIAPLLSNDAISVIISDNTADLNILRNFASNIWHTPTKELFHAGEILALENEHRGIFFCHTDVLRAKGNLYEITKNTSIAIERGNHIPIETWIETLLESGYEHDASLSTPYSYHKSGGILHIRGDESNIAYQCEWFDTEMDSIIATNTIDDSHEFRDRIILSKPNIATETSIELLPLHTELLDFIQKITTSGHSIVLGCDFLPDISVLQKYASIHISEVNLPGSTPLHIDVPQISDVKSLASLINTTSLPITCFTRYEATLKEFFALQTTKPITVLSTQFRHAESFLVEATTPTGLTPMLVLADDILGKIFVKNNRTGSLAKNLDLLISLRPGDLVVHRDHGIGRFDSIQEKTLGNSTREYLELHYGEGDKIFVPITEIFRISKYLGDPNIELSRLGGKEWETTLEKTDEELRQIAENILEINAKRSLSTGVAYPSFPDEELAFRKAFKYEHTPNQATAIDEIFADMEKETPMDRLLSGDVGFGKTEVAMNAAYKAVLGGMQVALISPLVVLAMEHYETFIERMRPFGVRVALLTRMNTPKEAESILQKLSHGEIDILIGTHRLLSSDIKWRRLGLLIIDEEHKFGVSHKESIKKLRANIDILSLSATPIPRSLNLALSGLRHISLLSTPPKQKKPIETIIARWSPAIVYNAIVHERARGGQIIVLVNRIRGMESLQKEISLMFTGESEEPPNIVVTHGRMSGDEIESRIHAFKEKKYDILLTTTIIENGVNFLSANTIIIVDPEDFGLASLHQLRGRVGRKSTQGYCYLAYRKAELSDEEKKRLITIASNNHLGAGFEIAMRDMEIRGAGDILGVAQSGNSKAVGLPLYFRMLEEKIAALKNEKRTQITCRIDIDISFRIPPSYFLSELDKLNFYREIENIETLEELAIIEDDMKHRLGNEQSFMEAKNLFLLLRARMIL